MTELFSANKSLGQHWLYDTSVLADIVQSANVSPEDTVLEIGSGLGTLTAVLCDQAQQVIAVEFDEQLAKDLPRRVTAANLRVVSQDILKFDFTQLPVGYKIVANIPYYLTSNLIRVISETSNPPSVAVLLVQKEVAERVASQPGSLSILGVTAQFYWQVSLGRVVAAQLFTPPPKIDSQVLILQLRSTPLFSDVDANIFFHLVKAGFSQRRKTLLNSLSGGLQLSRETVQMRCEIAGIDSARRAQSLSLDDWHALYKVWATQSA